MHGELSETYHGNNDGQRTHSQTGHDTANHELVPMRVYGGYLDDDSDGEDDTPKADAELPAHLTRICNGCSDESSDQGTNGEHADNEPAPDIAERVRSSRLLLGEILFEVVHFQKAYPSC